MNHNIPAFLLLVTAITIVGCAPKIVSFEASPRLVCEGQSTRVSWKTRGSTLLLSDPRLPGTGTVEPSGSRRFTLKKTTTFTLKATRNNREALFEQVVFTLPSTMKEEIVVHVKPDGDGGLVGVETLAPLIIDDFMRVETIRGPSDRPIKVIHEGKEVSLPANGTSSDGIRGTRFTGRWEVRAERLPGEKIDDPTHAPPDTLRFLVRLSCTARRE